MNTAQWLRDQAKDRPAAGADEVAWCDDMRAAADEIDGIEAAALQAASIYEAEIERLRNVNVGLMAALIEARKAMDLNSEWPGDLHVAIALLRGIDATITEARKRPKRLTDKPTPVSPNADEPENFSIRITR